MKRKTNKKSGIIAAVVGLSAVSLVSIGFASWVMSGGDTATVDGQIQVETVEDNRFIIYKTADNTNAHRVLIDYGNDVKGTAASKISFGIDDTSNITGAWLTASSTGAKYENLTATVSFYVANLQKTQTTVPSATLAVTSNTANWASAVTKEYVAAAPTTLTCAIGDDTFTEASLTYRQVTAEIEFAWGEFFTYQDDVVNPYVFYNHKTYDAATSSAAKVVLQEIETLLTGVNFTVTLTTTVPNA